MKKIEKIRIIVFAAVVISMFGCKDPGRDLEQAQRRSAPEVKTSGAMKNVMWQGRLEGTIHLDSIPNKNSLYGLGPAEFLRGELLTIDGISYKATVAKDSAIIVEETWDIKAPFFVYANVPQWQEQILPDSIISVGDLEEYISVKTQTLPRPFPFKLEGIAEKAFIHLQDLPEGTKVNSPDEAHQGQINYVLNMEEVQIAGFFSTEHKGIFTHHDSNIHMHLINKERSKMGHLDEISFLPGKVKFYLPLVENESYTGPLR